VRSPTRRWAGRNWDGLAAERGGRSRSRTAADRPGEQRCRRRCVMRSSPPACSPLETPHCWGDVGQRGLPARVYVWRPRENEAGPEARGLGESAGGRPPPWRCAVIRRRVTYAPPMRSRSKRKTGRSTRRRQPEVARWRSQRNRFEVRGTRCGAADLPRGLLAVAARRLWQPA
jgi:hypothetical protein